MRQFTLFAAIIAAMGAAYASSPAAAAVPVAADGFVDVIAAGSGQTVFIPGEGGAASGFSLADALTLERKASLWWEYARDVGSVVSVDCDWCNEGAGIMVVDLMWSSAQVRRWRLSLVCSCQP